MKRLSKVLLILAFMIAGCVSSKQMITEIGWNQNDPLPPKKTDVIIVKTTDFDCLVKAFLSKDYKVINENESRGYFLVEKVGDYDTSIRHNVVMQSNDTRITTEWKPGQNSQIMASSFSGIDVDTDWSKAVYSGGG